MKILIIFTHPNPQSFDGAILKQVQTNLSEAHSVKTLDLYAEQFNPILRFDENQKRRDLAKVPEMEKYRDLVTWADFAYSYKKVGLEGHLQGKSAWIITTHNTPAFVLPFIQDYGKVLKNQILKICAVAPVKLTQLTNVEKISDEQRQQFLETITQTARRI